MIGRAAGCPVVGDPTTVETGSPGPPSEPNAPSSGAGAPAGLCVTQDTFRRDHDFWKIRTRARPCQPARHSVVRRSKMRKSPVRDAFQRSLTRYSFLFGVVGVGL